MANKATSIALSMMIGICFAASAVTGVELAKLAEHKWFPVVTEFVIEQAVHMTDGDSVVIRGSMRKVRDCRFIEVVGLSGEKVVEVTFLDRIGGDKSRAPGVSDFGPWRLHPDASTMQLVVRHRCHGLWDSTTVIFEGSL